MWNNMHYYYDTVGRSRRLPQVNGRFVHIPGWDRMYEISEYGMVRRVSHYTVSGALVKPIEITTRYDTTGALTFTLKGRRCFSSATVLLSFIRPRYPNEIPHHINGNIQDCHVMNLEWVPFEKATPIEQKIYGSIVK